MTALRHSDRVIAKGLREDSLAFRNKKAFVRLGLGPEDSLFRAFAAGQTRKA